MESSERTLPANLPSVRGAFRRLHAPYDNSKLGHVPAFQRLTAQIIQPNCYS